MAQHPTVTLKDCFTKLDKEYGNSEMIKVEVFSRWEEKLETPKNDKEIVDFVENIEEGVGVLKSCGRENAVDNLFTTNLLERKMSRKMQIEFTNLLVSNPEKQIQKRMEFLLDFLNLQKSASRMRLNLYGQPCRTSLRRRGTRGTRRPKTCMVETKVNINDASAQKFF